jgi:uncharacterized protein YbaP (TraB family)
VRFAIAAAAAILSVSISAFGSATFAAPAMWRVSSPSSEIYLFGTLHALDPRGSNSVRARRGTSRR